MFKQILSLSLSRQILPSPAFATVCAAIHILATSAGAGTPADPASASIASYEPGDGAASRFDNPWTAVGAPSQFNPFGEPTDPFNPPYGTNQIVSIGAGGHLTLRFDTPLLNHPNNLFGLDFTIFGNAGFIITNEFDLDTFDWIGTPATDGSLFGSIAADLVVSVSHNGRDFFPLDPALAPRVDGFPPTDGTGDFRIPVPPGLSSADFAGTTLADIRGLYNGSAGGASFDLSWALDASGRHTALPEIRFIRIDVLSGRAEIDAVTRVGRVSNGQAMPLAIPLE